MKEQKREQPEEGEELKERFPFIAFVGPPGVGKSTLVEAFVRITETTLLEEPYQENPHLELFYTKDPWNHAFDTQMTFLAVRAEQMAKVPGQLNEQSIIQDSTFDGDITMELALWKMGYISGGEHEDYERAKKRIEKEILKPDISIFLYASGQTIEERVIKRGRPMELAMMKKNPEYFRKLADEFNSWFTEAKKSRKGLVFIDTEKFNLHDNDPEAEELVIRECCNWAGYYLRAPHALGLNYVGGDGAKLVFPNFLRPRGFIR